MKTKQLLEKTQQYIELFEKGYCKDCNELCVVDNFPNEDLKKLLKQWVEYYEASNNTIKDFENTLVHHSNIFYETER